jgi:hypothetical protein
VKRSAYRRVVQFVSFYQFMQPGLRHLTTYKLFVAERQLATHDRPPLSHPQQCDSSRVDFSVTGALSRREKCAAQTSLNEMSLGRL